MPGGRRTKTELRSEALQRRDAEPHRGKKSHAVCVRLQELEEFASAATVLTYVGVKSEVQTDEIVRRGLEDGKRVAVPWVAPEGLRAAFIRSLEELEPAKFGLLEPLQVLKADPGRVCRPDEVDVFVIPGLAFDRQGGRLGHGRAYYDRLLAQARRGAAFIALAFESQVVAEVPMSPTDVLMHAVVTEAGVYRTLNPPRENSRSPRAPAPSAPTRGGTAGP